MKKNTAAKESGGRTGVLFLTQAAVIAALYVALTLIFQPISYGEVQLRVSEALTILPFFTPAAIPGLFVGCLIANILGGAIILDIIFGSLATLIGAVFAYLLRKNRWLVPIPTILSNTVIVPLVLKFGYGVDLPLWLEAIAIFAGEFVSCYVFGEILLSALKPVQKAIFQKTAET
ncbi:MAG: QueT transporter family protein [Lachnospiraceae bacterium]|jgi:uncharacterized membrane protein